jgi:tetratricopeptide (TPR) repeat protein
LFEDGDEQEAFEQLRKTVTLAPRDTHTRWMLCDKLLQYDFDDEALAESEATVVAFPREPGALCTLARCHDRKGDYAAAEAASARAVDLSPESGFALRAHALQLDALGEHDRAIARAKQAVAARGGDPAMWTALVLVLRHAGRYTEADEAMTATIARNPEIGYLWADRTRLDLAMGQPERARASVAELVARRPKILRHWQLAARVAWHARDLIYLREVRTQLKTLPEERSRFGIRLLKEAFAQCDVYEAMLEARWSAAGELIRDALLGASRRDEFACTMACAEAIALVQTGDREAAQRILERNGTGPHGTRPCSEPDCADVKALTTAMQCATA